MLHVASDVSPVSALYLPCGHMEQCADPVTSLYLPPAQAVHGSPSGPVYPRLQMHLRLEATESECMGQFVQLSSDVWPVC